MKKKIIFGIMLLCCVKVVNAAPISVSASSNYVTSGSGVTFYVNISGAAWQLSGYSAGATSGCSLGDDGVGDSGNGNNVNKTLSVYCSATSVGQISFTVTGNVTDANGNTVDVSDSKTVTVQAPRQLDSNNNLASLGVEGYKISPLFSADTLEYSVDVPSTVNDVNITGSVASDYASIDGTGKKEVNEGANLFIITVTSETGVLKEYKLTVNVKDDNPIKVNLGEEEYTIIKNAKNIIKPELYEQTKITINNIEVPAFYNETTNITLIGVKDSKGNVKLAIYNKENNSYELYEENKSDQMILLIRTIDEVKDGYIKSEVKIGDFTYDCLKISEDSEYAIIYATNLLTGEDDYYLYDSKENSYVRYSEEQLEPLKRELSKYKDVVKYLVIGIGVLLFLLLISLITRPKKNKVKKEKKKIKKEEKIEDEKEEGKEEEKNEEVVPKRLTKKSENQSQKEAIESVEEAAKIIENFEKKSKDKKIVKEDEEEMYDIFEDDRKRKKK